MKELLIHKIQLSRRIGFFMLIIGLIYFVLIYFQAAPKEVPGTKGFGRLTGRFFPMLGGTVFILCSIIICVKSFFDKKAIEKNNNPEAIKVMLGQYESIKGVSKSEFITSFLIMVLGLIYVSVLPFLGYLIATIIAVFILTWTMGNKNWIYLFILAFVVPFVIYKIFISLLYVPIPKGLLLLMNF